jgi:hypothetical protein
MLAIFLREFAIATRRAPFTASLTAHLAVVSAFLLIWPVGLPVMHGSVYEQTRWIEAGVLVCLWPWASVRLASGSDANTRVRVVMLSGAAPPALAVGSMAAMAAVLTLITVTGLPLLLRAQQMSAAPLGRVTGDEMALVAFAWAAAAIGGAAAVIDDRVLRWLATAAMMMLMAVATGAVVHTSLAAGVIFVSVAAIVTLLVAQRAPASGRYLVDRLP